MRTGTALVAVVTCLAMACRLADAATPGTAAPQVVAAVSTESLQGRAPTVEFQLTMDDVVGIPTIKLFSTPPGFFSQGPGLNGGTLVQGDIVNGGWLRFRPELDTVDTLFLTWTLTDSTGTYFGITALACALQLEAIEADDLGVRLTNNQDGTVINLGAVGGNPPYAFSIAVSQFVGTGGKILDAATGADVTDGGSLSGGQVRLVPPTAGTAIHGDTQSFIYRVTDVNGLIDNAVVGLYFFNPPSVSSVYGRAPVDGPVESRFASVALVGSSPEGLMTSYTLMTLPAGGGIVSAPAPNGTLVPITVVPHTFASNSLHYVPDATPGVVTMYYQGSDARGTSNVASISITKYETPVPTPIALRSPINADSAFALAVTGGIPPFTFVVTKVDLLTGGRLYNGISDLVRDLVVVAPRIDVSVYVFFFFFFVLVVAVVDVVVDVVVAAVVVVDVVVVVLSR